MTAGSSSIPEVRRLLAVLASGRRAAEVGTALGDGADAIASSARALVTVEVDRTLAMAAQARFAAHAHVEVVCGDWREVLPARAPFEFLFLDGGGWKQRPREEGQLAIDLLVAGGILLVDDMTPDRPGPDPVREFVFSHQQLIATEILTTRDAAALIAIRR